MRPRVSVIMACYNASRWLYEAIDSVLAQSFDDFEFILINDGSKDNTLDIINRYASQDERIVIVDKENTGLPDSLNMGLRIARGEWIARLDADDISLPNRFARQLAFLDNCRSVVLVGTGCTLIDKRGTLGRSYQYPTKHNLLVAQICRVGSPFPHSSAMFHRQTAIRIGGYYPRFTRAQDIDMWLRLSSVGEVACLTEPLVKIRKHGSNISNHNGGTTSRIIGMAARICYILRSKGEVDPSQESDDNIWTEFIHWLTERMNQEFYFESQRQWSHIRSNFYNSIELDGRLLSSLKLVGGLLASGHTCRIIRNKLFASNLPLRLADEWIQVSANRIQKC